MSERPSRAISFDRNSDRFDWYFAVKALYYTSPIRFVLGLTLLTILICAYFVYIVER